VKNNRTVHTLDNYTRTKKQGFFFCKIFDKCFESRIFTGKSAGFFSDKKFASCPFCQSDFSVTFFKHARRKIKLQQKKQIEK
jgi:hypothetical protein